MRVPEETDSELDEKDIPSDFICPITGAIMQNPVCLAGSTHGHSFEHSAITTWLINHNTCPVTRENLSNRNLIPNRALKSLINTFLAEKPPLRIKRLETELQEAQKKAAQNIELEQNLRQTCHILNQEALHYAQAIQEMQALMKQLSAENRGLKENLANPIPPAKDKDETSEPADPKTARSVQAAVEPRLFSPSVLRLNSNGKIIPKGLLGIYLTVGAPLAHAKEGLHFGGVSLVFKDDAHGEVFKKELLKSSENNHYPITMHYSEWPWLGNLSNNGRFFNLFLPNSEAYFMSLKQPELQGLLILDIFEKHIDVTRIPRFIYSLMDSSIIHIKSLPNSYKKIKPVGLESIVLEVDEFFGTKRGSSFNGVKLIFKTPENAAEFRVRINSICQELQEDSSWQVRYSHAGPMKNNRAKDTILELFPILNSEFYSFLCGNMHLTGIMLLQALEKFFDISGVKKAIYSGRDGWINQESADPLSELPQPHK